MNKVLDKLKNNIKVNRNMVVFFLVLMLIGIVAGSIFLIITTSSDKKIVSDYLNDFFENINNLNYFNLFKNALYGNIFLCLIIWILGFSVIGIIVIIFIYFIKAFSIGFTLTSFILNYKFKGLLYSIFYFLFSSFLFMFSFTILVIYASSLCLKLINYIKKKERNDFKIIINKYLKILILVIIFLLINSLLESYILPFMFKIIGLILK